jgi:wyosine [tRNA(Phe)-imidazoG37] synthetase (radical SAM superfamily)
MYSFFYFLPTNLRNNVYLRKLKHKTTQEMTVIYPSPIFGPVHSRRLGVSLGINLLPADGKLCSFDCIYCECGFNADHRPKLPMPTREEVREALKAKLKDMQADGPAPDVLTFAGNGEPTLHPHFPEIIVDTLELRDKYFPQAKVSVLSNATMITKPEIRMALAKVDNNILKLDTIDMDYIYLTDRPVGKYSVEDIIGNMQTFEGNCIVQTMFMKGTYEGKDVNNTTDDYVIPWLEQVKEIAPRQVMIYTIDRETPAHGLMKATHEELDRIGELLREAGIPCSVSY